MGRLDGKVAAVTGGASGIGEATVRRFLAEGASVAFCDRDGERGQRVAAELETAGAKVAFTQADVGTEAACLAFVNGAAQKFGRLDILINNAGIRKYEKVDEASAASWNEILSVNLMSYAFCAKAAVPLMRRNKGGAIVNVASVTFRRRRRRQPAVRYHQGRYRGPDAGARRRPLGGGHSRERRRPRPDLHAVP